MLQARGSAFETPKKAETNRQHDCQARQALCTVLVQYLYIFWCIAKEEEAPSPMNAAAALEVETIKTVSGLRGGRERRQVAWARRETQHVIG